MTNSQLTLLRWIAKDINFDDDFVTIYVIRYNIPSEDGKFFVERTLNDGRKIRIQIVPDEIRNKVKSLRFKFYDILKRHGVLRTSFGRIVRAEKADSLRKELAIWLTRYRSVQKDIDLFLKRPWFYRDWAIIEKMIKTYDIKWPPKDLNIASKVYINIDGPIKMPKKLYDQLVFEAISGIEEEKQ